MLKCKKRECLNYSTYRVCGHTFAVSAYTSILTLFLQLQKDRHSADSLELSNFGNPSGSRTKKGYIRMRSKNSFDKGAKRTKPTKRCIISSVSSTDLTKLKNLIKCNNQPEVPLGQSLGPKPPHPEPQLQCYKLIKRCQQVSKCNSCDTLLDKTDEKLYILGRNEWYGKVTSTTKQYKIGQRNTYYWAKKRCILSRRPHLDIKEVKILTKSDVPEDISLFHATDLFLYPMKI